MARSLRWRSCSLRRALYINLGLAGVGMWGSRRASNDDIFDDVSLTGSCEEREGQPIGTNQRPGVYRPQGGGGYWEWSRERGWSVLEDMNDRACRAMVKLVISLVVFTAMMAGVIMAYQSGCIWCVMAVIGVCLLLCLALPVLFCPMLLGLILLLVMGWRISDNAFTIQWGGIIGDPGHKHE